MAKRCEICYNKTDMVGVDKRAIRFRIKQLRQIKTWQLVVLLVMAAFLSATLLRLNNIGMTERREAVINADKAGDVLALSQRLYDLQRYVSSHMNTDPGRIALDHTYKRVYDAKLKEYEESIKNSSSNDVVAKVRAVCDAKARQGGYGRFTTQADPRYVNCISEEWDKYPSAKTSSIKFVAPSTEPYYHTFVSPLWSADFVGWSVLLVMFLAFVILLRVAAMIILRLMLRHRSRVF